MPRTRLLLLTTTLALSVSAALAMSASAAPGPDVKVRILDRSQAAALERGVPVEVRSKRGRVQLRLGSSTFDQPGNTALAKRKRGVRLGADGRRKLRLKLTRDGRRAVAGCQARTLTIRASGASDSADLLRDTGRCRPRRIDLSAADRCDFIGDQGGSLCMLPFPDDYYTVRDAGTETGRRIDFDDAAMPQNAAGEPIDAGPYEFNDGFSPGVAMVLKIPGLDDEDAIKRTDPVMLDRLADYKRARAPIVVIDAETGKRWPIWTELDSNATSPDRRALLIHPARNFASGHRYVVAMRNLKNGEGKTLAAPEGFRYYRDDLPSKRAPINRQRDRFERIFRTLREAGIRRADLHLAWDFTVASNESIAERVLHMRDESLAQLGDTTMTDLVPQGTAPDFSVGSVENFTAEEDLNMARRVQGTFEVPCYMEPSCAPGGRFDLDRDGLPQQNGTYTAKFNCMIPRSAVDGTPAPARPSLYGHGLLGSANEATSDPQRTLGNRFNIVSCATDEIGLSGEDIPNTIGILADLGRFPELADRLQQGLLNELFLGRLMINADGFASSAAFHVDDSQPVGSTPYVIDPSRLYYNGNSQGAIEGGALVAISPDVTRGTLGVGGMNYSVLLNRSVDFDSYGSILNPAYTDELERPLALSLIQMLWDRGESNGYANTLGVNDPLPNTPASEVLMNVGFGDHQVSNFTADTMARTIGAPVHRPVVYGGRWPIQKVYGVPRIDSYPHRSSALVYWDSGPIRPDPEDPGEQIGTNAPPIANIPNREGQDPHELPRRTLAEQQMVSDFLRPNPQSLITDTCNGDPCYDFTFDGP